MRRLLTLTALLLALPTFASSGAPCSGSSSAECTQDSTPPTPTKRYSVRIDGAPVRGPESARVTLVVFGDFQCPYCARGAKVVKKLEALYPNDLRVVFMNEPLPIHAHARLAALAALAAQAQGQFWAFHDWLFSGKAMLTREAMIAEAGRLGLNVGQFTADLDSKRYEPTIDADQGQAQRLGVMGTPTWFIDGLKVTGVRPLSQLRAIIDAELSR